MSVNIFAINKPNLENEKTDFSFSTRTIMKMKISRIQESRKMEHDKKLQEYKNAVISHDTTDIIPKSKMRYSTSPEKNAVKGVIDPDRINPRKVEPPNEVGNSDLMNLKKSAFSKSLIFMVC